MTTYYYYSLSFILLPYLTPTGRCRCAAWCFFLLKGCFSFLLSPSPCSQGVVWLLEFSSNVGSLPYNVEHHEVTVVLFYITELNRRLYISVSDAAVAQAQGTDTSWVPPWQNSCIWHPGWLRVGWTNLTAKKDIFRASRTKIWGNYLTVIKVLNEKILGGDPHKGQKTDTWLERTSGLIWNFFHAWEKISLSGSPAQLGVFPSLWLHVRC